MEGLQNCQRNVVVQIYGVLYNELYKFEFEEERAWMIFKAMNGAEILEKINIEESEAIKKLIV